LTGDVSSRLGVAAPHVLATPVRAFRHRFPSYAGIFKPRLALHLIVINQFLRADSIVVVGVLFFYARCSLHQTGGLGRWSGTV
jgi:hypothetical protein